MGFLIAEISGLLALAAIAGGAFVYWWKGRNFMDVSSEYESLRRQLEELEVVRQAKAKADSRVAALEAENGQVARRLADELEWRRSVEPKLDELGGAVGKIKPTDLSAVEAKLGSLGGAVEKIRPADLKPIESKLGSLEGTVAKLHNADVSGIETKVAAVAAAIAARKSTDLSPVEQRLHAIEARLAGLRPTDVSGVEKEVGSLRAAVGAIKPADLGALEARLADVGRSVAKLQNADLSNVERRLASVEKTLSAIRPTDVASVERSVAAVQEQVRTLKNADLSPVEARLGALAQAVDRLEARIKAAPVTDYSAIVARLESMERTLAAPARPVAPQAPKPKAVAPRRDRKPGGNLLRAASHGKPDDLKRIKGVGPKLERMLHDIGVFYFWQVSDWRKADVQFVDDKLQVFKGRIERDDWVGQARSLAREAGARVRPAPGAQLASQG